MIGRMLLWVSGRSGPIIKWVSTTSLMKAFTRAKRATGSKTITQFIPKGFGLGRKKGNWWSRLKIGSNGKVHGIIAEMLLFLGIDQVLEHINEDEPEQLDRFCSKISAFCRDVTFTGDKAHDLLIINEMVDSDESQHREAVVRAMRACGYKFGFDGQDELIEKADGSVMGDFLYDEVEFADLDMLQVQAHVGDQRLDTPTTAVSLAEKLERQDLLKTACNALGVTPEAFEYIQAAVHLIERGDLDDYKLLNA